jgi:hypothetical protein
MRGTLERGKVIVFYTNEGELGVVGTAVLGYPFVAEGVRLPHLSRAVTPRSTPLNRERIRTSNA